MRIPDREARQGATESEPVNLYCMAAALADEASRTGHRDFARALESAIGGFLSGLPREQQADALRLSYEMALGGEDPAPPRLRLAYSRE